jgi:ligand-binding sensor domain-containing protein
VRTLAAMLLVPAALLGSSELGWAQSSTAIGHYQIDVWRSQDGARLAFTSNLVETRDGYLWLSSQSGLTRFDGVRFTVFNGRTVPLLENHPSLEIYPLLEDVDGALWIGTDDGLVAYAAGQFRLAAPDAVFATYQVNTAVADAEGTVWAVTRGGRVYRIPRGGTPRLVRGSDGSYSGSGVAIDAAGDVWITVGARNVYRVHHDSLSAVTLPPEANVNDVRRVYATADSSVWLGMPNAIAQWRRGRVRRIPFPPGHALDAVSCFAVGSDGALWIGTQGAGLFRYDGHDFMSFTRREGLSDDRISAILADRTGNIWVATRDGLNRVRSVPFDMITVRNGLPVDLPGGMIQDATGAVWLGPSTGGLFRGRVVGAQAAFTQVEPVSHADRINVLAPGRDSTVWVGRLGGVVTQFGITGQKKRDIRLGGAVPVSAILDDSDGTLWVGTVVGLFQFRDGHRRIFTTADGLPDNTVQRLFRDSRGTLWVATQRGIARATDVGDEHFIAHPMPSDAAGRALVFFEAPAGTVWVGSAEGLARVTGGPSVLLTASHGLPDEWIGAVEEDGMGHLWLGQLGGLTRLGEADLAAVADGRIPALTTVASFEALDGLPGGDPAAWGHPWSFRDANGLLWFAVAHGLVIVDPKHAERDVRPPVMHLEGVTIDGVSTPLQSPITLGPGVHRLEIRYTGVDLANGPGVRFRYRLDGFDTDWIEAGRQRLAAYTRLAPGAYRFRVMGRASGGGWSPTEATMEIAVQPPLYLRLPFLIVSLASVLLALWIWHRTILSTRSGAIRDERSRLAREIHDSLLQGFGAIALQLHAASARLALAPSQRPLLERVLTQIDQTLSRARDVVWDMRVAGLATTALAADCDEVARRIFATTPIEARVTGHGRTRQLKSTVHIETLRVVEEALTNVQKHAEATTVMVDLDYQWLRLRVTVADNGRGFDCDGERERAGHWGLLGMRERASRIGGRLRIDSCRGTGASIMLDVPYF